ncbi:hypothetical protein BKA63DRAFT_274578 [Paraphoma chrysanthemicola]|nr:hypothetical protein BKA63DRAFT_274578 [Paraphoma chrysanthemicola]
MGNTITRLTHHTSRHQHYDIDIPIPPDRVDNSASSPKSPPHHSPTFTFPPDSQPPPKPLLYPVPEEIIAATEKGMICENLLCSSLPSPALHQDPSRSQLNRQSQHAKHRTHTKSTHSERWHYFPDPEIQTDGASGRRHDSLDSQDSQHGHGQPRHEHEVLTRGEEACVGTGKEGSWGSAGERSVRWKGVDV